jgi:hypothetical protein
VSHIAYGTFFVVLWVEQAMQGIVMTQYKQGGRTKKLHIW